MRSPRLLLIGLTSLLVVTSAAQAQIRGFALERFEPSPAGEWSFWVDHPWFDGSRFSVAAGLTLDYGHNPLVFGVIDSRGFQTTERVVEHQLVGHLDLSASILDRVALSFSMPVTLLESGTAAGGVTPVGATAGDVRLGLTGRLYGRPMSDPFSILLSLDLWIPVSTHGAHSGDADVRARPKLILSGLVRERITWSLTGAFQYRADAALGTIPPVGGSTSGSELQLGAAFAYADLKNSFSLGPEIMLSTQLTNNASPFTRFYTSLEALLGFHYGARIYSKGKKVGQVNLGLGAGMGFLGEAGTPDFRAMARIDIVHRNYKEKLVPPLPPPSDRDGDGIIDAEDACPDEKGRRSPDPKKHGCPPRDRDHDSVVDDEDLCPDVPVGDYPDPDKRGCPMLDSDGDGVFDSADQCVDVVAGPHPDKHRPGCPDLDSDGDGVFDSHDVCLKEPAGIHPDTDPARLGCPLADRDHDQIPDVTDACPDKPGAPSADPKKNGCPGLVELKEGKLVILSPVFFATDKDVILPKSFPVLEAVASALAAETRLRRVSIEGHTDDRGKADHNRDLSDRRAKSVMRWLTQHGVAPARLEAHGFGPDKPIASNKTNKGRAANRRVEFLIKDSPEGDRIRGGN